MDRHRGHGAEHEDAAIDRLIATAPGFSPGSELRQRLAERIAAARSESMPIARETVVNDMHEMNDGYDTHPRNDQPAAHAGWRRTRLIAGTVAAALIVTLLVGTLLSHRLGTTPAQTGGSPTALSPCTPDKIKATLPAGAYLFDLAMVSPGEGWAVGAVADSSGGWGQTLILHYQHCVWTPISTSVSNASLESVSMVSADEGWAVGASGYGTLTPLVLHYTHGSWQQVALHSSSPIQGLPMMVRMLSATEGWIVLNHGKNTQGMLSESLLHLTNGTWSAANQPFSMITDVLPVAPNVAWVAGFRLDGEQGLLLYQYNAGQWISAALPAGVQVDTLHMASPNNLWASGHINAPSNYELDQTAVTLHYDGSQWQQVAITANGTPQYVEAFDSNTAWAFTLTSPQSNSGNGSASGGGQGTPTPTPNGSANEYSITEAQYQQDGMWHSVAWPFTNLIGVERITRVAPDTFWAIGSRWVGSTSTSVLLYFANGSWHEYRG